MANSPKLLNQGERVVVDTRTHVKVLIRPVLVLLLTVFAASYAAAQVSDQVDGDATRTTLSAGIGLVALVVVVLWVVRPFLSW